MRCTKRSGPTRAGSCTSRAAGRKRRSPAHPRVRRSAGRRSSTAARSARSYASPMVVAIPTLTTAIAADAASAVKLFLDDGERADLLGISVPSFTARTPEDFVEYVRLARRDPDTGQPDMTAIGAFLAAHPRRPPRWARPARCHRRRVGWRSPTTASTRFAGRPPTAVRVGFAPDGFPMVATRPSPTTRRTDVTATTSPPTSGSSAVRARRRSCCGPARARRRSARRSDRGLAGGSRGRRGRAIWSSNARSNRPRPNVTFGCSIRCGSVTESSRRTTRSCAFGLWCTTSRLAAGGRGVVPRRRR